MKNIMKNKGIIVFAIVAMFYIVLGVNSYASALSNNTITIESLGMTENIIESKTIAGIGKKVWHRPMSSTPAEGGNTVLSGHRYLSLGGYTKTIFTYLPEVKIGDKISVVWEGKRYNYEVYNTKIVSPKTIQIEFNTKDPILTLYTCTYSPFGKNRFVVQARLITEENSKVTLNN